MNLCRASHGHRSIQNTNQVYRRRMTAPLRSGYRPATSLTWLREILRLSLSPMTSPHLCILGYRAANSREIQPSPLGIVSWGRIWSFHGCDNAVLWVCDVLGRACGVWTERGILPLVLSRKRFHVCDDPGAGCIPEVTRHTYGIYRVIMSQYLTGLKYTSCSLTLHLLGANRRFEKQ